MFILGEHRCAMQHNILEKSKFVTLEYSKTSQIEVQDIQSIMYNSSLNLILNAIK